MFNRKVDTKQKDEKVFSLNEIKTLLTNNSKGNDRNKDGIADYLQREELQSIVQTNKDLNIWEVDTELEIERWIMGLRGYEYHPTKGVYIPISPPTLNEIGIRKLKTHMQAVVNKHSINTSIDEATAHRICQYHTSTLIKWFKYNAKLCEISHSDLTPIIAEFDNMAFFVISRSINDGQRKHTTDRTRLTGSVGAPAPSGFPG